MTIHESAEDYLEAILILHQRNGSVRSIDIAEALSVSKPSVSVAMKKLRTDSYIEMDDMGPSSPCCPRDRKLPSASMSGIPSWRPGSCGWALPPRPPRLTPAK